jgi:RNA polymerase sigma factor (sigma-70 family)
LEKPQNNRRSDDELMEMIRKGGMARNEAVGQLFAQTERIVFSALSKMGLDRMDIEETTHDALIICMDNICSGKYRKDASLGTYIVGIAKKCALNLLRKNKRRAQLDIPEEEEAALSPEELLLTMEKNRGLRAALEELGNPCNELLLLWANDYAYREILDIMGYANENSAKVQKFKCLQRLISIINSRKGLAGEE